VSNDKPRKAFIGTLTWLSFDCNMRLTPGFWPTSSPFVVIWSMVPTMLLPAALEDITRASDFFCLGPGSVVSLRRMARSGDMPGWEGRAPASDDPPGSSGCAAASGSLVASRSPGGARSVPGTWSSCNPTPRRRSLGPRPTRPGWIRRLQADSDLEPSTHRRAVG
jgi:hypothetical protein